MILLVACAAPPDSEELVYPYAYTLEADLEDYEQVRVETETWVPLVDMDETALYTKKSVYHRPGAPVETLDHFATMVDTIPPLAEGIRLNFAGDVMWIGANWAHAFDPVVSLFDADLRVANLETPTSPNQPTEQGALGLYAFNSDPSYLDGLPLDVVQLNNNHTLDAGESGLTDTLAEVEARGIAHTGIDAPLIVDVQGETVALLAFTWGINQQDVVPEHDLHIVPFGHEGNVDVGAVADAMVEADHVVVLLHWGYEYEYYPDPQFMVQARAILAAGADLVVGTGPHVVQPPELCHIDQGVAPGIGSCAMETGGEPREAAILYSLGNAATTMATAPCNVGVLATVSLGAGGVTGIGWDPLFINTAVPEVRPEPATDEETAELERLTAHIGAGWRR